MYPTDNGSGRDAHQSRQCPTRKELLWVERSEPIVGVLWLRQRGVSEESALRSFLECQIWWALLFPNRSFVLQPVVNDSVDVMVATWELHSSILWPTDCLSELVTRSALVLVVFRYAMTKMNLRTTSSIHQHLLMIILLILGILQHRVTYYPGYSHSVKCEIYHQISCDIIAWSPPPQRENIWWRQRGSSSGQVYFNLSGKWEFLHGRKIDVYHDSYLLTETTTSLCLVLTDDNYIEILIKEKYITDDLIRSDQFGHRIPLVGFIL